MLRRAQASSKARYPCYPWAGTRNIQRQMQGSPSLHLLSGVLPSCPHCKRLVHISAASPAKTPPKLLLPRAVVAVALAASHWGGKGALRGGRGVSEVWWAAVNLCAWLAAGPPVAAVARGPVDVVAGEAHPRAVRRGGLHASGRQRRRRRGCRRGRGRGRGRGLHPHHGHSAVDLRAGLAAAPPVASVPRRPIDVPTCQAGP